LVAYVATDSENSLSIPELRDFLKSILPEYMVPSAFVFLKKFPLTPSGKIDRKVLPMPEQLRPDLGKQFVAPSTPLEIDIAQIWCDVFRLNKIGRDDNFFELGGHSLIAIQIIARIRQKLGVELALPSIFKFPTVGHLAATILESLLIAADEEELTLKWLDEMNDDDAKKLLTAK
jgi:acyl carrier protein